MARPVISPLSSFKSYKTADWLISRLFEKNTIGQIYSEWNVGKSALAVDIACHVATGTPFCGRETESGPVLYLATEGINGLVRRFVGWLHQHEAKLPSSLYLSNATLRLPDQENEEYLKFVVEDIKVTHEQGPVLVIIDTLAQTMVGEQNSTSDVDKFTALLGELFAPATIMLLHHVGHGEKTRSRGASSLPAACDWEFRLEEEKSDGSDPDVLKFLRLINTKQRDEERQKDICFSMKRLVIAENEDGPVTTIMTLPVGERPRKAVQASSIGKTIKRMLHCLELVSGVAPGETLESDFKNPIRVSDWRYYCVSSGISAENFRKTKQRMIARNIISVQDEHVTGVHTGQP
jgi:hypothetical protein